MGPPARSVVSGARRQGATLGGQVGGGAGGVPPAPVAVSRFVQQNAEHANVISAEPASQQAGPQESVAAHVGASAA